MHLTFRRIPAEDHDKPRAVLLLPGVKSHWNGGLTPTKNIERIQAKAVFSLAAETIGVSNPTLAERIAIGSSYSSLERNRIFERLAKGEYRVVAGLTRQEPNLKHLLRKLEERGADAEHLLSWPLWELLRARLDPWQLQEMSDEVEAFCFYGVPAPPRPDVFDIARYVEELFPFDYENNCEMLHMAILCLNRAAASSNLAHYIITYEALFNAYLRAPFGDCMCEIVWIETLSHVNRWLRTLEIYINWLESGQVLFDKFAELREYGFDFKDTLLSRKRLKCEIIYPPPLKDKVSAIRLPDSITVIGKYM